MVLLLGITTFMFYWLFVFYQVMAVFIQYSDNDFGRGYSLFISINDYDYMVYRNMPTYWL